MTEEEIKQRNKSKEFLKDLQYYLFQNKRSPKIDKLSVLLDNDEKQIVDLERENAELRYQLNKNPCVCNTEWHCNDCLEQLTNAKEIIKLLLWDLRNRSYEPVKDIERAEQFLKDSEVEK